MLTVIERSLNLMTLLQASATKCITFLESLIHIVLALKEDVY